MQSKDGPVDPYAVPTASLHDARRIAATRPAPRLRRLGAFLVNVVGALATSVPIFVGYDFFGLSYLPEEDVPEATRASLVLLAFAPWAILNVHQIHTRSQSIGKRMFNIKVVRMDGSPASTTRQLLARFFVGQGLLGIVPLLRVIDTLCIFRSSHQTLHDGIADTIVVPIGERGY